MRKLSPVAKFAESVAKRLFWRRHMAEAMAEIRERCDALPTLEMKLALPLLFRGKGYFQTFDLRQNMHELVGLSRLLEERKPKTVCEIGTHRGGTLFVWCQIADPRAHIFSIDLPAALFGRSHDERAEQFFQCFVREGQTLHCLRANSRRPDTREHLTKRLNGRKLDFLFIDGDHRYEAVKSDYLAYSPLVAKGGLIAFHDIVRRDDRPKSGVWRLWGELRQNDSSAVEFVDTQSGQQKLGIGVLTQT